MTEDFLQYVWQHQLYVGALTTTEGKSVVVEYQGLPNHSAGPDFTNARLRIGDLLWAGQVEIHLRSSDWDHHHHSGDPNYDNVILHVVYEDNKPVLDKNGAKIPTVELHDSIPQHIFEQYETLVNAHDLHPMPCIFRIADIPSLVKQNFFDRLLMERLQRKTDDVQRLYEDSLHSWENTCYLLVARYFGGKTNGYAFEMLAKQTPMQVVGKIKDNPFRVEALYMGQAGMLEGSFADEYPQQLQREYNYLRHAYHLSPMSGGLWKFFRIRPASFPTIRISQFASLLSHSQSLFSKLLESAEPQQLQHYFSVESSPYWKTHYRFDKSSGNTPKHTTTDFVNLLLINAWTPLLFLYGQHHGDENCKQRAIQLLQQLPAESNSLLSAWTNAGEIISNASQSQALLQLRDNYCSSRRCLQCSFGHHLLSKKK